MLFVFAALSFAVSLILKRNDVADVSWGLGFVLVCVYLLIKSDITTPLLISCSLVIIWGLRLSIYIAIRNSKNSEDFRYKQWRDEWGTNFYWRSFLQVYLLQMLILLIISAPLLLLASGSINKSPDALTWLIILVWFIGFVWQAVADYQLFIFKKNSSGKVMKTGLWKYSRHPNYFGEIVMWWSLYFLTLSFGSSLLGIISPILITYLLFNVSGVPMLEEKYKKNQEYQEYVDSTPAIFPKLF
ncbi:DUF1295 domain-containing protein [Fulvivirga lutea]|uniref:DUF1295 domain-containing protein n=1 Tax=Fulvivirga lutea TaxID=2810512 RepID=A0A974WDY9_9BACT|nr:DUF1295 domain-containing protein [Fulvivirga lutea]QSE96479.1 DUF1295 domain-containing protein [Fulvivirga lutea]